MTESGERNESLFDVLVKLAVSTDELPADSSARHLYYKQLRILAETFSMTPDDSALRDDFLASIEACRKLKYNPGYFARMIGEHGAVGAARALLQASEVSEGFTRLYLLSAEHGPQVMHHCVEAIVLKPQHRGLFSPEELEVARQRLKQVGVAPAWAQDPDASA